MCKIYNMVQYLILDEEDITTVTTVTTTTSTSTITTISTITTSTTTSESTSASTQNVQDLLLSIFGDPKTTTETIQQEEMVLKKQSGFMPTPLIQESKNSPKSEEGNENEAGLEEGKKN